jgi:cytoskeletal protein CcmA (bactofilin family)
MSAPWLNSLTTSNFIKPTYVNGFLDVSGGDTINRNGNLVLIGGDASFNKRLFVGGDTSLNGNVYMAKDVTIYGRLQVNQYNTNAVVNTVSTNVFSLTEDISLNGRILTTGDASLNGRLFVRGDISLNGNLYVTPGSIPKSAIAGGDFGGSYFTNTQAKFTSVASQVTMNLDTTTANVLDVVGSLSISNAIGVGVTNPQYQVDVGAGNIGCGRFVQFGQAVPPAVPPASMTTNIIMGTFNDLLTTIAADTSLNGRLFVSADTSMNGRLFCGADASLNGRLYVGSGLTVTGPVTLPSNSIPTTAITGISAYATLAGATFTGTVYTPAIISSAGLTVTGPVTLPSNSIPTTAITGISAYATLAGATFTGTVYTPAIISSAGLTVTGPVTLPSNSIPTTAITGISSYATLAGATFTGLITANNGLTVSSDASLNGNLAVGGNFVVGGNLTVKAYTTTNVVNTITTNLFNIAEDVSLNGRFFMSSDASLNGRLFVSADTSMNGNLITGGNITALSFNAASDYRIKENIKPLSKEITVDGLKPIQYFNTRARKLDIGFLAHEVQEDFPYLVTGSKDGGDLQTLNYIGLMGVLVKEIQELKAKVSRLEEGKP